MKTIQIIFALLILLPGNSSGQVKAAIIQYAIQQADSVGKDDDRFEHFVREASSEGAKLIVGPETSFYRYSPWMQNNVSMLDLANQYNALSKRFSDLAMELSVYLVIGLREPSDDSLKPVFNTSLFFGKNGEILGKHRKLNPSNDEKSYTKAGEIIKGDGTPFFTPLGMVGMLICKDMDNSLDCKSCPDWDLQLAAKNPDLFIGVNGDPSRGWVKVARGCREAKCFGIGSNLAKNAWSEKSGGGSGFVNPDGQVIEDAGLGEKIIYETLPLTEK
jgi:predicted amidohydrolase